MTQSTPEKLASLKAKLSKSKCASESYTLENEIERTEMELTEMQRNDAMTQSKHTPTPWEYKFERIGKTELQPSGNYTFETIAHTNEQGSANAAFIVKAVNMHERMVTLLTKFSEETAFGNLLYEWFDEATELAKEAKGEA